MTRAIKIPVTRENLEAVASAVAARLRPGDAAEVMASDGQTPLEACLHAASLPDAWYATFGGEPAALWGVHVLRRSTLGALATVWLLTTDVVERYPKVFWRESQAELRRLLDLDGGRIRLVNAIDARYTQALRWASRLGLQLSLPTPYGSPGNYACWFIVSKEDL